MTSRRGPAPISFRSWLETSLARARLGSWLGATFAALLLGSCGLGHNPDLPLAGTPDDSDQGSTGLDFGDGDAGRGDGDGAESPSPCNDVGPGGQGGAPGPSQDLPSALGPFSSSGGAPEAGGAMSQNAVANPPCSDE